MSRRVLGRGRKLKKLRPFPIFPIMPGIIPLTIGTLGIFLTEAAPFATSADAVPISGESSGTDFGAIPASGAMRRIWRLSLSGR